MKYCVKCVMPSTRPGITFDENGVLKNKSDIVIDGMINILLDDSEKNAEFEVFNATAKIFDILQNIDYDLTRLKKEDKKFIVDDYTWKTFGVTDVKLTKETMI